MSSQSANVDTDVDYVVCCAPRRSGSSLMHNVIVDVLATTNFSSSVQVVKAHHPTSANYLKTEGTRRRHVYVARDFRDTIVSDITLYELPNRFWRTASMSVLPESLRSYRYWRRQPHFYTTTYDALTGDLAARALEVAEFLGAELTEEDAEEIAERHSANKVQAEVEAHYAKSPVAQQADIDSKIGFRQGHFQGGETGKWQRVLSPWQVAFIEFHARSWLEENGFRLSQSRPRQWLAAVAGAPFMLAGWLVVRTKLALGRTQVH